MSATSVEKTSAPDVRTLNMGTEEATITLPSDREIQITRVFERPAHLLFEAWTQPDHLRNWWGCDGSSLIVCEIDFRPGGAWHFVSRMADGSEHSFRGVYREIVPNRRLVYTECYENAAIGNPEWLTTVTFEELGDQTRLTHLLRHQSVQSRDGHLQAGMQGGANQTLNRLDRYAASMAQDPAGNAR